MSSPLKPSEFYREDFIEQIPSNRFHYAKAVVTVVAVVAVVSVIAVVAIVAFIVVVAIRAVVIVTAVKAVRILSSRFHQAGFIVW